MNHVRPSVFTFLVLFCGVMLCASEIYAQGGRGRRGGRGADGARGGRGGGIQSLLQREDVQKELDLIDEQIEQIELLNENGRRRGQGGEDRRAEMEGLSDEERRERMREMRSERESEVQAKIEEILLPEQLERLNQLSVQLRTQRGGRGMLNGSVAEALGITDDQKAQIEERAEELQREMNEKINELRRQMQEELMKELTPEQREKLEELTGTPFEFQQQERERGRGGRAEGDRPGRRGGQDRRGGGNRRPGGDDQRTDF